jgi:hypothetical protein
MNSVLTAQLRSTDSQRLQWESVQSLAPYVAPDRAHVESRPIHIECPTALSLPKLRSEWLRPSAEASAADLINSSERTHLKPLEFAEQKEVRKP